MKIYITLVVLSVLAVVGALPQQADNSIDCSECEQCATLEEKGCELICNLCQLCKFFGLFDKGDGVEVKGKCAKCWQGSKEECMSACEPNLTACTDLCPTCTDSTRRRRWA